MITQDTMAAVAELMDDQARETVHAELAPCEPAAFLRRYRELVGPEEWAGLVAEVPDLRCLDVYTIRRPGCASWAELAGSVAEVAAEYARAEDVVRGHRIYTEDLVDVTDDILAQAEGEE